MLRQLIKLFTPPDFPDDEEKSRKAKYTYWITNFILSLGITFEVYLRLVRNYTSFSMMDVFLIGLMAVCIIGLLRLRLGHVRSTSIMLVILLWLISNGLAASGFGVKDTSYIVNSTIVLIAGLLLSWRAAVIVTLFSVASGFALAYAENTGWIVVPAFPVSNFVANLTYVFLLNAILIWLMISGRKNALRRAKSSAEELASANAVVSFTQGELQNRSTEEEKN